MNWRTNLKKQKNKKKQASCDAGLNTNQPGSSKQRAVLVQARLSSRPLRRCPICGCSSWPAFPSLKFTDWIGSSAQGPVQLWLPLPLPSNSLSDTYSLWSPSHLCSLSAEPLLFPSWGRWDVCPLYVMERSYLVRTEPSPPQETWLKVPLLGITRNALTH